MKYGDKIKLVNQYEETTFGYLNTWSSNFTGPNLVGPVAETTVQVAESPSKSSSASPPPS